MGFPPRRLTFIARELPGTFYSNLRIASIFRREIGGERKERERDRDREREGDRESGRDTQIERERKREGAGEKGREK